jgi:uncharacterized protein
VETEMEFEFNWDEEKNEQNIRDHGIDFNDAKEIFYGPTIESLDADHSAAEERYTAYGMATGRVLRVTYTMRGEVYRLISARKADRNDTRRYYEHVFGQT